MASFIRFFACGVAIALNSAVGVAHAQQSPSAPVALSVDEQAAVATLLNSVNSQEGDALRSSISGVTEALGKTGGNVRAVISTVKIGAGGKLDKLNAALSGLCSDGRASTDIYCQLAAIVPPQESSAIQTSATGDAGGAGGDGAGGGIGGSAQTNSGGNKGTTSSQSLPVTSSPSTGSFSSPSFTASFGTNTFASATPNVGTSSVPTISATLSVPGPVAGGGMSALLGLGLLWWRSRRPS